MPEDLKWNGASQQCQIEEQMFVTKKIKMNKFTFLFPPESIN